MSPGRPQFHVAPLGGTWLDRAKGIYKTPRGNIGRLTKSQLRQEKRLSTQARLRRVELWIGNQWLRDADIGRRIVEAQAIR